ncbi:hypothetical protein, partial [Moorena sp. SIO3I6]|uniref:hypothetical protein n=1 Tax=Moorena sp. SIO3I6 TaxID=2607831 RepID=UPI0025FC81C6
PYTNHKYSNTNYSGSYSSDAARSCGKPPLALWIKTMRYTKIFPCSLLSIPDSRLPTPDSRFPIPDSRFPIPDSRFPFNT